MSKISISSHEDLAAFVGKEIGVSDWHQISQEQINQFADATLDHQWIHVDKERAVKESPFGDTIAHGYLTLSLLPYLWNQIVEVSNFKLQVNYGIENFKFGQAVVVGGRVRLCTKLVECLDLRGVTKATIEATLEIEDQKKPAYRGNVIFLYHFNH